MKRKIYDSEVEFYVFNHSQLKFRFKELNDNEQLVINYIKEEKEAILDQLNYDFEERVAIMTESGFPDNWATFVAKLNFIDKPENIDKKLWEFILKNLDQVLADKAIFLENCICKNFESNLKLLAELIIAAGKEDLKYFIQKVKNRVNFSVN